MKDLGRVLFEYKVTNDRVAGLGVAVAVLLGGGGAWALAAEPPRVDLATWLLAAAAIVFPASFFVGRDSVRVHEHGIVQQGRLFGARVWRDEEFEHMTWRGVQQPVGVAITAELTTQTSRFRVQRIVDTGGAMQRNLEALRDRIASQIAGRAQQELKRGVPFAWGSARGASVRLQPDGIAYRKALFVGHEEKLVLWAQPLQVAVSGGFCAVAADGETLFTLATAEPDFFPGLVLLTTHGRVRSV